VQPQIIVALGESVANVLLGHNVGKGITGGKEVWEDAGSVIPVRVAAHPAAALWGCESSIRSRKRMLYEDWKAISAFYRQLPTQ
jgi:uracil-DNA glycosylase